MRCGGSSQGWGRSPGLLELMTGTPSTPSSSGKVPCASSPFLGLRIPQCSSSEPPAGSVALLSASSCSGVTLSRFSLFAFSHSFLSFLVELDK